MLARHFPPIGGAGVHRTVGSVRYLPVHGYEPVVVTGAPAHRDRWEPRDDELLASVPGHTAVHRVPGEPAGSWSRSDRLRRLPAPWVRHWVAESVRLGSRVGRGTDMVYASCVPYETAFAAARVARTLGRPWVADLEDAWAFDEMRVLPSSVHRAIDLRQMRRALATASAVVMSAPEAAERVRSGMPELAARVIAGIPIGFEPADFAIAPAPRTPGTFRIVHAGTMHTDLGQHLRRTRRRRRLLGGAVAGLDILPRSHVFVVKAIETLIACDPAVKGRIELHLAGDMTPEDVAATQHSAFVYARGLLSHADTVALMRSADLLFLPMHELRTGERATLIPYKTFEYLAAGRPILAAIPDGDVRDMLAPLPVAEVVRPADVEAMAAAIRMRIAAADRSAGGREPDVDPPPAYQRATSVACIASVLDAVQAG
jgi:glycosyltransferase involved in cell wall biosynthesis